MIDCYQCMDKGIITIPIENKNNMIYDYMFQCSCGKGCFFTQLPTLNIQNESVRGFLKKLADKNYREHEEYMKSDKKHNSRGVTNEN